MKMVIFHVMLSYQRLYCNHSISWSKIICTLIRISIAKYWSKNIPPSVCYDFPYVSYKTGVGKCSILGILNIAFRHLEMKYQLFCWVMLNFRTFTNKNIYETILIYMVWDLKSSQLTPVRKKKHHRNLGWRKKKTPHLWIPVAGMPLLGRRSQASSALVSGKIFTGNPWFLPSNSSN